MTEAADLEWKKNPRTWELVQMLIKCRDALPAITLLRRDMYNVPADLDKQIEKLLEPWKLPDGQDGI